MFEIDGLWLAYQNNYRIKFDLVAQESVSEHPFLVKDDFEYPTWNIAASFNALIGFGNLLRIVTREEPFASRKYQ